MSPPATLNIPPLIDQQEGESDARTFASGLNFLNPPPSPECREAILPFLCLSIFQLCDSSHQLHSIVRGECLRLRDSICIEQWRQAEAFLGAGVLPVCEDLPDTIDNCIEGKITSYVQWSNQMEKDNPAKNTLLDPLLSRSI